MSTRTARGCTRRAVRTYTRDFFAERREAARARRAERQGIIPTGEATELDPT